MTAPDFPAQTPLFHVFLVLTGVRATTAISLRFIRCSREDVDEVEVAGSPEIEVEAGDPLAIRELSVAISGMVWPEPGEYRIRVVWEGERIAEKRIVVQARSAL